MLKSRCRYDITYHVKNRNCFVTDHDGRVILRKKLCVFFNNQNGANYRIVKKEDVKENAYRYAPKACSEMLGLDQLTIFRSGELSCCRFVISRSKTCLETVSTEKWLPEL